jgi:hypothetical protein
LHVLATLVPSFIAAIRGDSFILLILMSYRFVYPRTAPVALKSSHRPRLLLLRSSLLLLQVGSSFRIIMV